MGKTPTLIDGDFSLWESGAILLYLAEKYGKVPDSLEQRALINKWLFFASATLDPFALIDPATFAAEGREQKLDRFLTPINQILEQQTFITGNEFTVADVALGLIFFFMKEYLKLELSAYPAVISYLQRLAQRPAFQNTLVAQLKAMSEG
jgi:glutathione S-transferase